MTQTMTDNDTDKDIDTDTNTSRAPPVHYGLRAQHLRTRKIKAALWTYNKGRNWYSCLLKARKYMVLPAP